MLKRVIVAFISCFGLSSGPANAIPFGYLEDAGSVDPTVPITAAGHTAVALTDLTAALLASVDALWVTNGDNFAPPSAVVNNVSALSDWVFAGGVLSYHDRYVSGGGVDMATILPGAGGIVFTRDFSNDADIDIINGSTIVTTGLDSTSLDGGTSSSHGYVDVTTLPGGAAAILGIGGDPTKIVDFYYQFGAGWVYYSTIPLDFYLAGAGPNPPRDNFTSIYAVNEARFQAGLAGGPTSVPAPATFALLGAGLVLLGSKRFA